MSPDFLVSAVTAVLALALAIALFDQWRARRHAFQAVWGIGMVFYAVGAGAAAVAAAAGWSDPLYRTWYLVGAMWTATWLGLGTAFVLGGTLFGYAFAVSLFLAGLFTFLTWVKYPALYHDVGSVPILYFLAAGLLALAVGVETYFQNERWPILAAIAVVGATLLSLGLMVTATIPAPGYAISPDTGMPVGDLIPPVIRLLTPFMNVTGAFALILGAVFSAYVFMPKRRVLAYTLDPEQPGDQFLFNLLISPIAISVNFVASLPGATRALLTGRIHSRVPATILIAIGAIVPTVTDSFSRFGSTPFFEIGLLVGLVIIFLGFLVSIEVFREVRVPFTGIVLRPEREEAGPALAPAGRQAALSDEPSERPAKA
jgi:hypothetical protein